MLEFMTTSRDVSMTAPEMLVSQILIGRESLSGLMSVPPIASGLVLFAYVGRNVEHEDTSQDLAQALQRRGLATLRLNLLSHQEAKDPQNVFDIPLLALRLRDAVSSAKVVSAISDLPIGLIASKTGAAAALVASALMGEEIRGIVCHRGRPDLAKAFLPKVLSPTLLIVGENDVATNSSNQRAFEKLNSVKRLQDASHAMSQISCALTIERQAQLIGDWFLKYLPRATKQ